MSANKMLVGKIMRGGAIVIAVVLAVLGYSTHMARQVKASVADANRMIAMRDHTTQAMIWATDYALTWKQESKDRIASSAEVGKKTLKEMRESYKDNAAMLTRIELLEKRFNEFQTQGAQMADAYIKYDRVVGNSYIDAYHEAGDKLEKSSTELIDVFRRETNRALDRSILVSIIAAILIFIVILFPTYFFTTATVNQIKNLISFGNDIGEGNLTRSLEVDRGDELGLLAQCFNAFTARLNDIVQRLLDTTGILTKSAKGMGESATRMKESASKQSNQTGQVSRALGELNKTVAEVARNSQRAAEAAKQAAEEAKGGGEVVEQTVHGMQIISKAVQASTQVVHALGKSSDQIGAIIKTIEDIADQTNLLALNAAIEAARAGDQGRGFAVVADEVRKLAERTTQATKEIADMIGTIQQDTKGVVLSMEEGGKEVTRGVDLANRAGEALRRIVVMVGQMTDMVSQIAAAAEEHSATTEEISASVELVSNLSQGFTDDAGKTYTASMELQAMADTLNGIVQNFKLRKKV
ncbi:MAG TPA: methyl-accepting chemotaxis protein [Elusimicrobia bacterium]|nr:methyl-accepting chemotaxis protein [Elusimicrobiota bacterium]